MIMGISDTMAFLGLFLGSCVAMAIYGNEILSGVRGNKVTAHEGVKASEHNPVFYKGKSDSGKVIQATPIRFYKSAGNEYQLLQIDFQTDDGRTVREEAIFPFQIQPLNVQAVLNVDGAWFGFSGDKKSQLDSLEEIRTYETQATVERARADEQSTSYQRMPLKFGAFTKELKKLTSSGMGFGMPMFGSRPSVPNFGMGGGGGGEE